MAKTIRIHEFGGPDVFQVEDHDLPAPGPGEVRLRQRAVGLNYIDVYQRQGAYPNPLPLTLGNEAAGDVVAVGEGVTEFKEGDRVAYGTALGAYAEERNVPARLLVHLPEAISYEVGAVMMLKGLTAQYLLRQVYAVVPGSTILVHAAAGGVGLFLCQWGHALGATVIGTAGSAEKCELAKRHGADHCIEYRREDFAARVAEITGGALCDVVYDAIGQATFPKSLDCLRPLGMFASYGAASGPIAAFDINLLAKKGSLFATRPSLFAYSAKREALVRMTEDLVTAIETGAVRPEIHARYPLAEVAEAHRALEARETTGSTILVP
ncbi:quinone oxidoreductase [Lichenibacterium minor]|jgi:NADPH2:quinone reductase|uniref:Quinone oxidoreductase n=1 Tax=Lichenibacterium minor TaxID=2316528 RepID=A0A4Q2U694_9HYPH|nr:quinone oxidoreductase [Lichenibacterium minor]RYC31850.1 quinone oxidoreductase [Lichenibacterium minor]